MPDRPLLHEVWLWAAGINLHKAEFLNIQSHVTENFFKGLMYTPHGLADTLPFYVASGIYDFLKIPLNEFWLHFSQVFLGLVSVLLIYLAGRDLFSPAAGMIGAALFAILPIDAVTFYPLLYYHHDFLIFLQLILFMSLIGYCKKKSFVPASLLSLALLVNAGTENMFMLPVVMLFQWIFEYEKSCSLKLSVKNFFKEVFTIRYLAILTPYMCMIALHIYIYQRIGGSNLGIIGYVTGITYSTLGFSVSGIPSLVKNQIGMIYDNFFRLYSVIIASTAVFYLARERRDINARFMGLMGWFLFYFAINVLSRQGLTTETFRYSHNFVPLMLMSGYLTVYLVGYLKSLKMSEAFKRYAVFLLAVFLAVLFLYNTALVLKNVLSRKVYLNVVKAAAFYTREHGDAKSTIFQLVPSSSRRSALGEYYFGKPYMEPGDETGAERQLFCLGRHSIDEYKKAYGIKEFDFYIEYRDCPVPKEARGYIAAHKLKKVADIARREEFIASIYSPHPFPYEAIDISKADKLWDKKYANLRNLFQNRWCGLCILWGYHHRLD